MREYLDILEDLILQEDRKKVFAIFFVILLSAISAVSYFFIYPKIEEILKKKEDLTALEKKILKNSPNTIQSKIALKKKEILKNQSKKENLKLQMLALQSKLENINFSFINPINFSTFLDYLLKNSIKHNLLINSIKIEDKQKPFIGKLYVKKSLSVNGSGRFLNIIKFARVLESKKMLFNLEKFNIETNGSMPNFSFKIDFYGVRD